MTDAYERLRAKVDAFAEGVHARRGSDLACAPGCTACCEVSLTVAPVEAERIAAHLSGLSRERRAELAERARTAPSRSACVMLDDDGRCAIYAARPLVCRTQGLPLRYPEGFVPLEAVRMRIGTSPVTWCPLNFAERAPEPADVLDAERVDATLALVQRLEAEASGSDPEARVALVALAAAGMESP